MQQLETFGKEYEALKKLNVETVAIDTDDLAAAKALKNNKDGIKFPMPIVADPKLALFKRYRAYDDFENQPLHGTFLIDAQGKVRFQRMSADPFLDVEFIKSEAARVNRMLGQGQREETARGDAVALGDPAFAPYDEAVLPSKRLFGAIMSTVELLQDRGSESPPAAPSTVPDLPLDRPFARHGHRLQPLERKPAGSLLIHEIYRSLQGESTFAGLPCVFIRLTACNLRCTYCDTPHAFTEGQVLDLDSVFTRTLELGDELVEITGGKPLLQPEVYPLMTRLADAGKTVLLETRRRDRHCPVDARVRVILDIKTPGPGEVEANVWTNLDRLKAIDEVKFVICSRADFDWAAGIVRKARVERAVLSCSARRLARSSPPSWPVGSSRHLWRSGSSFSTTRYCGIPRRVGFEVSGTSARTHHHPSKGRRPIQY